MRHPRLKGLLIRAEAGASFGIAGHTTLGIGGTKFELEPLFKTAAPPAELGLGPAPEWYLAQSAATLDDANPWEVIHQSISEGLGIGLGREITYAEPDLEQQFLAFPGEPEQLPVKERRGEPDPQDPDFPTGPGFAWFLKDAYSQLGSARKDKAGAKARIAHIDTGYDPQHDTVPENLLPDFGYDFVDDKRDARDPGVDGFPNNYGHGTGTLSILAGSRVKELDDYLGGAPLAEIIPIRIATSVILLRTSALARALRHALVPNDANGKKLRPVEVLSLSMGGVASRAWADGVNEAYEAGICMVAAAGNNVWTGLFPFPTRFIVYPARFRRVIAACGVMADRTPYYGLGVGKMQGNFGPQSKMATAMAAYTPNMPWAEIRSGDVVDMNGPGTSSATPQVAAAAALWMARHHDELQKYDAPWKRVEAVRYALFSSADRTADGGSSEKLGNGILQAEAALQVQPPQHVTRTPPDSATFSFLRVLTGLGAKPDSPRTAMYALEIAQLAQQWEDRTTPSPFEAILPDPDLPAEAIPPRMVGEFLEAMIEHPRASRALQQYLKQTFAGAYPGPSPKGKTGVGERKEQPPTGAGPPTAPPTGGAPVRELPPEPPYRRLRVYAIDPTLKQVLETAPISEIILQVPWERLAPGPRGEYLEVIDYDPASKCQYSPVNLDEPVLLAQDGYAPSEGTPQFHQQMAYAVASVTIRNFERALGRKAMWAPGPTPDPKNPDDDSYYIQRLRIYPHALREANAYYSPAKIALLFGYYNASGDDPGGHLPGGMVFTCLSHDVIAHEASHALLDGMHRRFKLPTNPDMRAFHEAFADIVALFQHFTFPEILRHQIARTRGEIRLQESLLGQLAGEFGRTTGMRGALRDAIGRSNPATGKWEPHPPDPREYGQSDEPHERGRILVAAVFDAFLSIYESRVSDLLRLATGGSGVLPAGAIHPDLIGRLSEEAAKAASHVLTMCIRALDYCPPVDLTFGEYLRALITADCDLVPDDDLNYRIAFLEAFRKRGLYPRDVRTLSVESLLWRSPDTDSQRPSPDLLRGIERLRHYAEKHLYAKTRRAIFFISREMRRDVHDWLKGHFAGPKGQQDAEYLGLDAGDKFEVHSARLANRIGPDGQMLPQFILSIMQKRRVPVDANQPKGETMTFEGGCTIVADLRGLQIQYCIRKNVCSQARLERQQEFVQRLGQESLRATYMGQDDPAAMREPFALLHRP